MPSELFVSRFAGRTWAAVRVDGRTTELRVETDESARATVGRIVQARVTRVLPGMQVAFVDVGLDRDGFLHVSDLILPGEADPGDAAAGLVDPDEVPDDVAAGPDREAMRGAPIQDRLSEGAELLVQITREPIRSKGARVTTHLSFAGRMLVYLPLARLRGISRKIEDEHERRRLRRIVQGFPQPGGFICRTVGEGADEDDLAADAAALHASWERARALAESSTAPAVLHDEGDVVARILRDAPSGGFDRLLVDDVPTRDRIRAYLRASDPRDGVARAARVELHDGGRPMFESHALDQDVERVLRPRVWLKSGGYIVIEPTEALVSIDVNTGKYVGKSRPEDTVLKTNLEAAAEIARQLRLRDLGGIIVVDFIDMSSGDSRRQVLEALEQALARDRTRTKIVGLSELGLVQLTRKRTRPGVGSLLTRPCPTCHGQGRVKAIGTVAWEALREIHRVLPSLTPERVTVRAQPDVLQSFAALWHAEEPPDGVDRALVRLEEDPSLDPESYDVEFR